ncbi:class I SAM-dependent methyltransferase [Candidatus Bathyarchaeota archaeon]|nr:class I SAM-dependent methyltransferase [Candidatus Bathyarchaeota archaeon]
MQAQKKLPIEEIEKLGYYDFMGYLEVPYFNIGGVASIDRLAELLGLDADTRVLEVGCGTGGNACYLANKYGCHITGIDTAERMVKQAQARAEELGIMDLVAFKAGDAYDLDFPDGSFDVVYTIFVSQFLDPSKAYTEFNRVLVGGGRLGINEMYREEEVPPEIMGRVEEGERVFRDITELPFRVRSDAEWKNHFIDAGFVNIVVDKYTNVARRGDALKMVKEFGGWWRIVKTIWEMLVLAARSKRIRQRIGLIGKGKGILVNDRVVSRYIGYILCVGYKS